MNIYEQVKEKSIEDYAQKHDLKGKKILLRIDVNTSLGENAVVDPGEDWRIIKSYQTINFLREKGACIILVSHIGRNKEESLKPVFEYMSQEIPMGFIPYYDKEVLEHSFQSMQHGSVFMLENIRQFDQELENDNSFLKNVTQYCDYYVNDAFSVSHREHASVHSVTQLLPSYFGIQFVNEVSYLYKVLDTEGTISLVLGGAKFGTKLALLKKMLPRLSYVLLGGALANVFLRDRGFEIGASFVDDVDISEMLYDKKIILPVDCVDQDGDIIDIDKVSPSDMILDIGPDTESLFEQVLAHSDFVLWNGPMGKYEDGFTSGSISVANSLSHSQAFSVTGGGDTATVVLQEGLSDKLDFISTGGGAMLDFLVDGSLVGIDVIVNK